MTRRDTRDPGIRWALVVSGALLVLLVLGTLRRLEAEPLRAVCRAQLAAWAPDARPGNDRVSTCLRLARLADAAGPHAALTLAVAFEESHWSPADAEGAVRGTCQLAACHCPGGTFRGCDLEEACAATVARLMSEEQGSETVVLRRWLRGYRVGHAGPIDAAGEAFAGAIRQTAEDIEQQLAVRAAEER